MCARDSDGTESISNTPKVEKASSLKKLHCTPPAVLDVGEFKSGSSSPVLRKAIFVENYEDSSKSIQCKILETNRKLFEENKHGIVYGMC